MVERILRLGVSFTVGIYVARYLGVEAFGSISFAQSLVGIVSILSVLGMNDIVVKALVDNPKSKNKIMGSAFVLRLAGASIAICLVAILAVFLDISLMEKWLVIIISVGLLFQSINVIDLYFQSMVKSRFVVQAQFVQLVISTLVKLLLVLNQADLIWFGAVLLVDSIVLAIALGKIYLVQGESFIHWRFKLDTAKSLLRDAWPLLLSGAAILIYMKIDQVMIRNMLDASAVGYYSAAVKISEAWYFVPVVICTSLFPAILKSKALAPIEYQQRLQRLYDAMVWMAVGITLPVSFFADSLIRVTFGDEFSAAAPVLQIHIWAAVFVSLGVASSKWMVAENYQKKILYRTSYGLLINIVLNYFLIRRYGINGAAVATLVSQIVVGLGYDMFDRDVRSQAVLKLKSIFFISVFQQLNRLLMTKRDRA